MARRPGGDCHIVACQGWSPRTAPCYIDTLHREQRDGSQRRTPWAPCAAAGWQIHARTKAHSEQQIFTTLLCVIGPRGASAASGEPGRSLDIPPGYLANPPYHFRVSWELSVRFKPLELRFRATTVDSLNRRKSAFTDAAIAGRAFK